MDQDNMYQRLGISISPWQLLSAAQRLVEQCPDAELYKNRVGDLSVLVDGEYRGIVHLASGGVDLWGPGEVFDDGQGGDDSGQEGSAGVPGP